MKGLTGRGKRVVVLGSSGGKKQEIVRCLADCDCRVQSVSKGPEAFAALKNGPKADLLIVDMGVGEEEMKAFVSHLKNTPGTNRIPIIALVDRDDIGAVADVLGAGCDEFLHKPVNSGLVRQKVHSLLDLPPRGSNRVPCGVIVETGLGEKAAVGKIVEIGEEGAGLLLEGMMEKEEVLELRFSLPHGSDKFIVEASVVHIEDAYGRYLHGVRFTRVDARTGGKIKQYVQEAMSNSKPG